MRKSLVYMAFLFCLSTLQAQITNYDVAEGDVFILGKPSSSSYSNIDFPRKNIIIKRGAIANFNALIGKRLVVQQIATDKNGAKLAILKRQDGRNFFRFFPQVEANLSKAIELGELKTTGHKGQHAIAQQ